MYVIDHGRWSKNNDSWARATPLLKEVFGYTDEDVQNFIRVQECHYFPPFAVDVTKEQAALILQPFLDNEINVFCFIYDDVTLKPIDFCYSKSGLGITKQSPKAHYYDEPIISAKQRVDPFNPPTFDSGWVNLSLGLNENNKTTQHSPTTITCPYCKSTDCKKISGLSKAGSVVLWGIFALGKTTKQFHCNSCKADF